MTERVSTTVCPLCGESFEGDHEVYLRVHLETTSSQSLRQDKCDLSLVRASLALPIGENYSEHDTIYFTDSGVYVVRWGYFTPDEDGLHGVYTITQEQAQEEIRKCLVEFDECIRHWSSALIKLDGLFEKHVTGE